MTCLHSKEPENCLENDYFAQCALNGHPVIDYLVIDAHAHLGHDSRSAYNESSVDSVVAAMDLIGIDKTAVSAFWAFSGFNPMGNDLVIDAVQRFPDRIIGQMSVSVGYPDSILKELQRCYEAGLKVVKLLNATVIEGYPYRHPNYKIVFDFASNHNLPVLLHTWGANGLEGIFEMYPKINWILAHAGAAEEDKYIKFANDFDNVYLELCHSGCRRGLIRRFIQAVPLERILWGSDQIFLDAATQIGRILLTRDITFEQKKAILGQNALKALRFGKV
jgi:uncharacterized protein